MLTSTGRLCGPVSSVFTAGMLGSLHHVARLAAKADTFVVVIRSADSKLYEPIFYSYWSGAGDNWGTKPKLYQCHGLKSHPI